MDEELVLEQFVYLKRELEAVGYEQYELSSFAKADHRSRHNTSYWQFNPEPKQLILFPSYLQHQVMLQDNDETRCSLAFNIMPIGHWGDGDSALDTQWI